MLYYEEEIGMVKTYSLKSDGETSISTNFKVKEFACKDGTDEILIDTELVNILQKYRDYIKQPVIIVSGYRTESHNQLVNGKINSYHLKGMAAQIKVDGVKCEDIAHWFYINGVNGIGIIDDAGVRSVHIDTRRDARFCFKQIDSEIIVVEKF